METTYPLILKVFFSIAIQRKRTTTPIDKKMMKRSQSESDTLE